MADWAAALAQGVGAAANSGAQALGDQIKSDQQLQQQQQLAQQAANIQLDLHTRMAAADNMMKNAALQRYSAIVKQQMGVPADVSAPTVQQTGLTAASFVKPWENAGAATPATAPGAAAGSDDEDDEDGTPAAPAASNGAPPGAAGSAFTGDATKINGILKEMQDRARNPNATPEQKAEANDVIDALNRQIAAQQGINKDSVKGKTRARTLEEAVEAANAQALQDDPEAYVAGTTAYNNANKDDIAEKRLTQQAALSREAGARQERIAQMRQDALVAKLGGGSAKEQANVAQMEYLMKQRGLSQDQALAYVYGDGTGLTKDPASLAVTLATQFLANGAVNVTKDDPPGTTKASKAMQMAMDQVKTLGALRHGSGMLDTALPGMPAAPGAATGTDPLALRPLIGK